MKTLLLIRHAESVFSLPQQADIDRQLTAGGKRDAESMAARVEGFGLTPDGFVISGSKRTVQTTGYFNTENKKTIVADILYQATQADYFEIILNFPKYWNTVAICAHNPAISEFINSIVDIPFYNMPPGAVYAIRVHTNDWSNFVEANKETLFYIFPD